MAIGDPSSVGTLRPADLPKAGRGLGRHFTAMLLWQIGNYLVPLVTFPYLTRVLGPAQFGVLGYVSAMAIYGTVLTEWGFNLSGPRAVAQCRHIPVVLNQLIWSTMGAKAVLCALSFAALLLVLHFDHRVSAGTNVVLLSWLTVVGNVFTLNWLLQGIERFALFAVVSLAGRFITLPLTFLFVRGTDDVAAAVVIQAAAPLLGGVCSLVVVSRLGLLGRPIVSWHQVWKRIVEGADMFVATASVSLFSATNAIILGSLAGSYQVGLYTAADKLKTVGNMVPAQINTVLYPRVCALFAEQRVDRTRTAAKLTLFGALATVATTGVGVVLIVLLAGPLTGWVLGARYEGSASILTLLCTATLFGNLAYFLGLQVIVPFGGTRRRSGAMLAAGVLNVVLALVLVPHFGAEGAAIAFLIAEAAVLGAYVVFILGSAPLRGHFTQLLNR
ncbi:flippase [Paraburkholderia megapolitana]|uniref:flippase n=1 Tax=Paraburkholderia megapolitana TaxID=420953 RepID=UPI0038B82EE4